MSDFSDSDSDYPAQVFPVPKSDTDNPPDPQRALTSPEGYIQFVRHEAESYPDVFYAPPPANENECNAVSVPEKVSHSHTYSTEQENRWLNFFTESVEEYQFCKSVLLEDCAKKERLTSQQLTNSALFDGVPSLSWIAMRSRVELDSILELLASQCTRKRWKRSMVCFTW
ncbi:hypothetical protein D915_001229 [Fasciola hepatica]|uniref:Uncharacterized protein n=1 Tax=Fasciola hepatica TaxID=6192 RepID=A0A4E0RMD5_FASHE|nr:hypothetical protein D915_001229 [Fasciola hepatica]